MASPSGTPGSRRDPDEIQPGECHNCGYSAEVCECESPDFEPPADPVVSPAATPARAQQVQRGLEPAETLPELVDAIRQDTAGIWACVSSIRFIASTRGDVPKSVMEWVDRLSAHADRLESKCALALTGDEHGR